MAGTTYPTITLDLCTASCNAVAGIQAYQGKKIWDEEASVENEVRALNPEEQGRMWLWVKSRTSPAYPWQPYQVVIAAELLIRLDRDKSSVMDLCYDLVEKVCNKLENATTFSSVPALPMGLTWSSIDDNSPEDNVIRFSIEANFKVGPACES